MTITPDYAVLDKPEITGFVFYPRRVWNRAPPGAEDYLIAVGNGTSISSRFYPSEGRKACVLYFHGNGEVACDYDMFAPDFHAVGASLFVADYRGYGRSSGSPGIRTMVQDASAVYAFFRDTFGERYGRPFVMGRSLGALSALEIAASPQNGLAGMIIESGTYSLARVLQHLGFPLHERHVTELENALREMVRSIRLRSLIMHGEADMLIPASEGRLLFESLGAEDKRLVVIPGGNHNDLMFVGKRQYYAAIRDFILGA